MSSIDCAGDHLVLATFSKGRPLTSATQAGGAKWWWTSMRLGAGGAAAWKADNRWPRAVAARPSEVKALTRNLRRATSVTTDLWTRLAPGASLQQRNAVDRRRRRNRSEKRVDVREILVGDDFCGVRWHLAGRLPDIRR